MSGRMHMAVVLHGLVWNYPRNLTPIRSQGSTPTSNSSWNVSFSGDWNTPADWLGSVPDSATANATISLPGTYTVDISGGETITAASVTLNNATLRAPPVGDCLHIIAKTVYSLNEVVG
jgi:hypothetical protein